MTHYRRYFLYDTNVLMHPNIELWFTRTEICPKDTVQWKARDMIGRPIKLTAEANEKTSRGAM